MKIITIILGLLGIVAYAFDQKSKGLEIPVYRKAIYKIPESFEPIKSITTAELVISNLIYDGLVSVDHRLNIEPQIASSWAISSNGTIYSFIIKKGLFFHDGTRLGTGEVKASIDRLYQDGSPVQSVFEKIKATKISSDGKLVIYLKTPYPPFLSLLASPVARIFRETKDKQYAVGSGPFILKESGVENGHNYLKLKKNMTYQGLKPNINTLEIWEGDENWTLEKAFDGFIHDTSNYTSKVGLENSDSKVKQVSAPAAITWIVSINNGISPLNKYGVRKCLVTHFPQTKFIKELFPDHLEARGFLPPTMLGSNLALEKRSDVESECASPPNRRLTLDIPKELSGYEDVCNLIEMSYEKVGVEVQCNPIAFDKLIERINTKTNDLSLLAMTLDYPDVEYFLSVFESKAAFNIANFNSKSVDEALQLAREEEDREKRALFWEAINEELYDSYATINISHPNQVSYLHKCIENFQIGITGDAYIDYSRLALAPSCQFKGDFHEHQ